MHIAPLPTTHSVPTHSTVHVKSKSPCMKNQKKGDSIIRLKNAYFINALCLYDSLTQTLTSICNLNLYIPRVQLHRAYEQCIVN